MGKSIALVGVSDGLGRGKMTYGYFLPPFEKTLVGLDVQIRYYSYREFIVFGQQHDAAILLYGEVKARKDLGQWNTLVEADRAAKKRGTGIVIHSPAIGRIVADKTLTSDALSSAGIDMPKRVTGPVATFKVFSNDNMGSHAPTYLVAPRLPLDQTRYNTEWIDARHEYQGRNYYVVLRAMAVGGRCLSVFVRARPVEQGDASVHNTDTPVDAGLWNFFYRTIVISKMPAIESLCEKIANVLGLGFFSHDILPERETGRLLVCETGFKFDDYLYRRHLMPLAGQLAADEFLSDRFPAHSAELFAGELKQHSRPPVSHSWLGKAARRRNGHRESAGPGSGSGITPPKEGRRRPTWHRRLCSIGQPTRESGLSRCFSTVFCFPNATVPGESEVTPSNNANASFRTGESGGRKWARVSDPIFISNCEGAMRPLLLASVSIAALFIASEASAADLAVKAPRPMMVPAPVFSWTGCYVGAQVGWGWGHQRHNQPALVPGTSGGTVLGNAAGKVNSSGGLFGGQVGCNYQFASNWVIGVQGDIAGTDFNGRNDDPLGLLIPHPPFSSTIAIKSDWMASATARIGYAFYDNRALFYVKGGGAWIHNIWDLHDAFAVYDPSQVGERRQGWTGGAGFEFMLTQNWTAFVEGNYYDFGKGKLLEVSPSDPAAFLSSKQTVETVKIGVNYKFGGDTPVVAKY